MILNLLIDAEMSSLVVGFTVGLKSVVRQSYAASAHRTLDQVGA